MSLNGNTQDVVVGQMTDGDGRLDRTVRHFGGGAVIGGRGTGAASGDRSMTAGYDGRFEGWFAAGSMARKPL